MDLNEPKYFIETNRKLVYCFMGLSPFYSCRFQRLPDEKPNNVPTMLFPSIPFCHHCPNRCRRAPKTSPLEMNALQFLKLVSNTIYAYLKQVWLSNTCHFMWAILRTWYGIVQIVLCVITMKYVTKSKDRKHCAEMLFSSLFRMNSLNVE